METILWVLPYAPLFLLVISLVITVHELGHYWVGRWFGAAAESFAIGFGKPIWEVRDRRGTRWRINWIPLGGFVKFVGEAQLAQDVTADQPPTVETEEQRAQLARAHRPAAAVDGVETTLYEDQVLVGKPYTLLNPWQRIAVSLGGPFANFIFAILAFAIIGYAHGVPQAKEVYVRDVTVGSAAELAGFKPGDVVIQAGNRPVSTADDIIQATSLNSGEKVSYRIRRGAEELTLVAVPTEVEEYNPSLKMKQKIGRIGIAPGHRDTSARSLNPIEALAFGAWRTGDTIAQTVNVLRRLVTGREGLDKLSGPVGILHLTSGVTDATMSQPDVSFGEKISQLFWMLFQLAALLSVGIGFFNLLPLPVLDGGAVMMHLAEGVTGKPLPERVQSAGLTIGLVCLVGFALVVTLQDVFRLSGGS